MSPIRFTWLLGQMFPYSSFINPTARGCIYVLCYVIKKHWRIQERRAPVKQSLPVFSPLYFFANSSIYFNYFFAYSATFFFSPFLTNFSAIFAIFFWHFSISFYLSFCDILSHFFIFFATFLSTIFSEFCANFPPFFIFTAIS